MSACVWGGGLHLSGVERLGVSGGGVVDKAIAVLSFSHRQLGRLEVAVHVTPQLLDHGLGLITSLLDADGLLCARTRSNQAQSSQATAMSTEVQTYRWPVSDNAKHTRRNEPINESDKRGAASLRSRDPSGTYVSRELPPPQNFLHCPHILPSRPKSMRHDHSDARARLQRRMRPRGGVHSGIGGGNWAWKAPPTKRPNPQVQRGGSSQALLAGETGLLLFHPGPEPATATAQPPYAGYGASSRPGTCEHDSAPHRRMPREQPGKSCLGRRRQPPVRDFPPRAAWYRPLANREGAHEWSVHPTRAYGVCGSPHPFLASATALSWQGPPDAKCVSSCQMQGTADD